MSGYFESAGAERGGAVIALDEVEISILRSLAAQLLELIGPDPAPAGGKGGGADSDDPLEALDALFIDGPSEPPRDPTLARLFPDAYGEPGQEPDEDIRRLSAEFRRFTETDLRTRKREDLLAVVRGLDAIAGEASAPGVGGAVLTLKPDESRQWLGALNDLRLAIATRLGIADDDSTDSLFAMPDTDPDKPMVMAYFWLGGLQESLVETLLP
ncbi:DUF2017 domain-containing protein [Streptomyces sp. NBC_01803]|uniref:DUF2017 domain-containing protein n=1 Tax=Streptomyces sp. NBC_01803 TaxID=2975946 RepID=UPI002DDA9914|nr:DUF2017 domain-containing protein [Streptomyces sp. NBC_01803]WSA44393.1 DUF2017 domain-containing protein [Streptomyces sp. NBC_01803]